MKIEYVLGTKSESHSVVQLTLIEVARPTTGEEKAGLGSHVSVSSPLVLTYVKGNSEFDAARRLPVGHKLVLEF